MWLRIIINTIFLVIQIIIYKFLSYLENQGDKCPCSNGWKLIQSKFITNIMILLNVINIFIPLNRGLYNIPIIGGSISIIYLLLLVGELILVYNISNELNKPDCKKCDIGDYKYLVSFFNNQSIISCIGYSIIISIVLLYF